MEVLKSTGFIDQLTKKLKLSEVAQSGALNLRLAALVRTRLTVNPSPRVNNHCTVHLCKCALRTAQRCVFIGSCPMHCAMIIYGGDGITVNLVRTNAASRKLCAPD